MFIGIKIIQGVCSHNVKHPKIFQSLIGVRKLKVRRNFCLSSSEFHSHDLASQKVSLVRKVVPVNKFVQRSHTCGELTVDNVGEKVQLCGWLQFQRLGKFIILRDSYGSTQCIVPENRADLSNMTKDITFESVLTVCGTVAQRPSGQENASMKTGSIEVLLESLEVLNHAKAQLPFSLREFNRAKENLQMQYRYLALRFPDLQRNLRLRSVVISKMREFLISHCGFVDIETPTLFRRTPGGAQEYVVPSRHEGKFYSLVQSPQQFKQLLMIGGFDRYFQVARCYRDEVSKPNRQPEFTQLDIEMSFTDREKLLELVEELIAFSWPEDFSPIKLPFARISYTNAMEKYGSDSPDLNIPHQIQDMTELLEDELSGDIVRELFGACAIVFPGCIVHLTNSTQEKLKVSATCFENAKVVQLKISGNSYISKLSKLIPENLVNTIVEKMQAKEGDVLFLAYGHKQDAQRAIGKLRVEFANIVENKGQKIRSPGFNFVWVLDFPLFTINDDNNLESTHHPFTQPHPEDAKYLMTKPKNVRSLHYDLVLNGSEIAGGSIRVHEPQMQAQILKMLKIDTNQLKHLLEALESGAPPHGGIALGLDRFISLLCKTSSIREVIAFPKTMEGRDLMSGAPAPISEEEKTLYHLK